MSVPRIAYSQQQAVLSERAKGRTDRQIENIVGLPYGFLCRPYIVDVAEQRDMVRGGHAHEAWKQRDDRWRQSTSRPTRTFHGWRPDGDCLTAKPNAARARPKRSLV